VNLAIFSGFKKRLATPGWTKESAVAVFGGGELDLTAAPPGEGAVLTAVAVFGGIELVVPAGTRVSMSGFGLFGGRAIEVEPGDGPELRLRAVAVFGGVEVRPPKQPR
jgi:hypothetical protein